MLLLRTANRRERNGLIERHKAAAMRNSKCKEINVGELARSVDARRLDDPGVEQAHIVRPEFMSPMRYCLAQAFGDRNHRHVLRIARLRHDAHASILRDRTAR